MKFLRNLLISPFRQYRGLKKELYILLIGNLVTAMGSFVWPMLTFFLTTKIGMSDGDAIFVMAVFSLVTLPASVLGGKLADKYSRKKLIVVFDVLTVSLYVVAAVLPIGIWTAILFFVSGVFQNLESPAYNALSADFSTSEQRERAYSMSYLGYNLGFVVGATFSGILFESHMRLSFLLNGCAILFSTVLILLFIHPENAVQEQQQQEQTALLGEYEQPADPNLSTLRVFRMRPVVLLVSLVGCIASVLNMGESTVLPLQLKEELGAAGATLYGYLNAVNGLVVIVFTPILTMLLKRMRELPKAALGALFYAAGIFLFSLGNTPWVLFFAMLILTFGEVTTVIGMDPYTSRRVPCTHRGRVDGLLSVVSSLYYSLGQFLVSWLLQMTQNRYSVLWAMFIACGVLSALLYLLTYRMDKKAFPLLYGKK